MRWWSPDVLSEIGMSTLSWLLVIYISCHAPALSRTKAFNLQAGLGTLDALACTQMCKNSCLSNLACACSVLLSKL